MLHRMPDPHHSGMADWGEMVVSLKHSLSVALMNAVHSCQCLVEDILLGCQTEVMDMSIDLWMVTVQWVLIGDMSAEQSVLTGDMLTE